LGAALIFGANYLNITGAARLERRNSAIS